MPRIQPDTEPVFAIPKPKGKHPGPIPASTPYVAPVVDEAEAAAFRPLAGRPSPRGSTRSHHAEAISAAKARMLGIHREVDTANPQAAPTSEPPPEPPPEPEPEPMPPAAQAAPQAAPLAALAQTDPDPDTLIRTRWTTIADVDRLWDWIRADPDQGESFCGLRITSSVQLHTYVQLIQQGETRQESAIRAVTYRDEHLGFAMLLPILAAEHTALMHLYLSPMRRGQIATLTPALVEIASQIFPGIHLAVLSPDPAFARLHRSLLGPLGFHEYTMFLR